MLLGVDVHLGLHVVDQIPSRMIDAFVNHRIIGGTVPAPTGGEVRYAIHVIPIGWTEMLEMAVFKGMCDHAAFVVRCVVAVPVVIVH
jgi:hypothetical protein